MDNSKRAQPTKGELDILRVLWDLGPSTVKEAHETLNRQRPMGYTTVLKLMQIMVDKGLLQRTELADRGRAHVYQPTESEANAKTDLVNDLMDRAFGGSAREIVMHALAAKPASKEELDQIRRMLDDLEAGRG